MTYGKIVLGDVKAECVVPSGKLTVTGEIDAQTPKGFKFANYFRKKHVK